MKPTKILLIFFLTTCLFSIAQEQLPAWQEGMMDIHHINTGRGDSAFAILPDGTTLLIDAGDMSETRPRTLSARNAELVPNRSKNAMEWIVDYIQQFHPLREKAVLNYALITHYHDDHFGEMDSARKEVKEGYFLTGLVEVGHHLPIHTVIDRGIDFPINLKKPEIQAKLSKNDAFGMIATLKNLWNFVDFHSQKNGMTHETLKAGEQNQIVLRKNQTSFPDFRIRNIAVNGKVWTGEKNTTFSVFQEGNYPGENPLSTCIKISYGPFDYFTGGDVSGIGPFGATDFNSMESHIAPVVGPVDVATLNHHGNRDSQSTEYVRTVRPRVWIQQNWSSDHPGEEVLRRIASKELYPGERDIFSTVMLQPLKDVIGGRLDQYKSQNGHVVLRVYEKGNNYEIFILNDRSEKREIIAQHGPYESR
ncbi:ComEC/Rec2 family competence protein [Euzebyella saccharophila]|uniref:ComEC/Rec2 family competence protein n=1 Tax=Euzebyella saccharophila TaxID=679664 RepID=A0ABV8JPY5_9FLAO|nr:hypothetical protein [Euzebyella saccharophila]